MASIFSPLSYPAGAGIHGLLESAARDHGDAVAIRFGDFELTYRAFDAMAEDFAAVLADRGVASGQRVAVLAGNRPEFFGAVFGILKLGAAAVMVSSAWKEVEVAHAFDLTEPNLVVTDGDTHLRLPAHMADRVLHLDDDGEVRVCSTARARRRLLPDPTLKIGARPTLCWCLVLEPPGCPRRCATPTPG